MKLEGNKKHILPVLLFQEYSLLQIKESDTVHLVRLHNCKIFTYFAKTNGRACITFAKSQSLLAEKFRHELFEQAFPE